MDEHTFRVIMWVGGLLIMIIGFFIAMYIKRTTSKQDESDERIMAIQLQLTESINKLQLSITGLNGLLMSMQQGNDTFSQGCAKTHHIVDKRLDDHARTLREHEKSITALEVKIVG
jgi:hypothetical protein